MPDGQSQTGVRFSAKAAMPLAASGPGTARRTARASPRTRRRGGASARRPSIRLVSATARGAPALIPVHSWATVASTSSLTCVTRPIDRASAASNGSPVSIAAAILPAGTRRRIGTEMIAAATPMRTSVRAKLVDVVHDHEVAGRHQPDPAGADGALHGGDRRAVGVHQPFERVDHRARIGRPLGALLEVGAGTEGRTEMGQHDRSGALLLGDVDRLVQLGQQLARQRVAVVLRVERDGRDPVDHLRRDDLSHPRTVSILVVLVNLLHTRVRNKFTRTLGARTPSPQNFYTRDVTDLRNDFPAGVLTGDAVAQLFAFAKSEQFAIPAANCIGTNSMNAVMETAGKLNSPVIIQFSSSGSAFVAGKAVPVSGDQASILGSLAGAAARAHDGRGLRRPGDPPHRPLPEAEARLDRRPARPRRGALRADGPAAVQFAHARPVGGADGGEHRHLRRVPPADGEDRHDPRDRARDHRRRGGRCRQLRRQSGRPLLEARGGGLRLRAPVGGRARTSRSPRPSAMSTGCTSRAT